MKTIDLRRVAAATNFVHRELLQAAAAEDAGKALEALEHYRSAANAACRVMKEEVVPHRAQWSIDIEKSTGGFGGKPLDVETVREFLEVEERLLREIGLEPDLVTIIMDRCLDFTEYPLPHWEQQQALDILETAEYHVCENAQRKLELGSKHAEDKISRRSTGRQLFRTAVGITIIATNACSLDVTGVLFGLSTGYGLSYLPIFGKE